MYCPKCKAAVPEDATICPNCGKTGLKPQKAGRSGKKFRIIASAVGVIALIVAIICVFAIRRQEPERALPAEVVNEAATTARTASAPAREFTVRETTTAVTTRETTTETTTRETTAAATTRPVAVPSTTAMSAARTSILMTTAVMTTVPERVPAARNDSSYDYVLNTNTMKFHHTWCDSVRKIKDKNRENFSGSRDEILARGFVPCKICNP